MEKQRAKNEAKSQILDKRPCFFKIICSRDIERLGIPPLFMKHISKNMTKTAILEGPFGGNWHVKLHKEVDGTYLQDGWQDFSREHSLGNYEFLIFRYDGKMSFQVTIFDNSGCERTKGSGNHCRERNAPIDTPRRNKKKSSKCKEGSGVESIEGNVKTEDLEYEGADFQMKNSNKRKRSACEPPVEELETRDKKSAESFTSKFPFCIIHLAKYYVHYLKMPNSFSQHFSQGKLEMCLRNSQGKSWLVRVLSADKAPVLSGGWRAFARENLLKEGDSCVFELVENNEMHVHIYRSNK